MVAWAIWLESTRRWNWCWLSVSPGDSIRSRASISKMMPPKIAIQTIQVRGGTRNSPPFLGRLSSSLCLLSFAIVSNSCAKLARSDEQEPNQGGDDANRQHAPHHAQQHGVGLAHLHHRHTQQLLFHLARQPGFGMEGDGF